VPFFDDPAAVSEVIRARARAAAAMDRGRV
jgi:hypothetical protein